MLGIAAAIWNVLLIFIAGGLCWYLVTNYTQPWVECSNRSKIMFLLLFTTFVLFMPNIAYLFTDARHIADYCDFDALHRCTNHHWMNLGYSVYGALGIPFFLLTIRRTSAMLAVMFHGSLKFINPPVFIFLSALGVRIGLFERFNSWNILNDPLSIVTTSFGHIINLDPALWSFTLLLGILYYWSWFWLDRFSR